MARHRHRKRRLLRRVALAAANGAMWQAHALWTAFRRTNLTDRAGATGRRREGATARAGVRGGLPTRTMATARKYHWELLGDSGVRWDAGPLTSESAISGRPAATGPRVITSSILHTFWLISRPKYDLEYWPSALPRSRT